MAKSREGKRMVALEVDTSLYEAIYGLALDHGVGVSGVIRMVLIDYLKRYRGYDPSKDERRDG